MSEQANRNPSKLQALERAFDAGLKLLSADDLQPTTPCPDSWTFALYVQRQVDEQTRRKINKHIAFCDECYREYVALAEPEEIIKEVQKELRSTTAASWERSSEAWCRLMEHLKNFVIDMGKKYGAGVMLGPVRILAETSAVKGTRSPVKSSKLLETSVGNNTYRIQLGLRRDGSLQWDIDGHKIADRIALRVAIRRDTGEALFVTETNTHGNVDFVMRNEQVPHNMLVLDLHLDGHESQIAFRVPL